MRPTKLVVAGLHSYRDPVTVDFEELGRHGLFGIFGPIGSGKSTLLDAMTLALYGLVDRVNTRSRQGLVNLGSERCEVKLQFAIDSASRRQHFEVQRAYRLKDGTAQRTLSRLVEYTPTGPEVIADKERDVNEAVIELVGLGPEDFMRAVVLPQGKFLELLHLKGSERRQMLQRVFRLHAYGGRLRRQISTRQQAAEQSIASVQGELRGLGEATGEGLARARQVAEQASAERLEARAAAEARRGEVERTRRLRLEHARLAEARRALADHRVAEPEISALEAQLAAIRALEPIVAPIERWRTARAHQRELARVHDEASRAVVAAQREWAAARDRAAAVAREDAAQRPLLAQRTRELEVLQSAVEAREGLEREQTEAHAARTGHQASIEQAEAAVAEASERVAELETKRRQLRRRLGQRRVGAEERERATAAAEAAEHLERARAAAAEIREALDAARGEQVDAEQAVADAEAAVAAAEVGHEAARSRRAELLGAPEAALEAAALRERVAEQTRLEGELALADGRRARLEGRLPAALADRDRAATDAEAARLAAEEARAGAARDVAGQLAGSLEPDRPCPVCGSLDHPRPPRGRGSGPDVDAARAAHEAALAARAAVEAELESLQRTLAEAIRAVDDAQSGLDGLGAGAREALAAHEAWVVEHAAAVEQVHDAALAVERARGPLGVAQRRLDDRRAACEAAEARLERARAAEARAWDAFHERRGELTLFDVRNALIAIASRDREAEQLQRELDELDHAWIAAMQARDARQGARDRARDQLLRLDERIAMLESRLASLARPPGDPAAARRQIDEAVAALDRASAEATRAVDVATAAHRDAENQLATARGQLDAGERSLRGARSDVLEVLRTSVLWADAPALAADVDGAEVDERLDAVVEHWASSGDDLPDPAAAAARVARHRETEVALQARLAALDDGSGPEPEALSDETLQALQDAAERDQARLDEAIEAAVAAQREVEELERRKPRVEELRAQLEQLDHEATQLGVLAQVMRGDRFVEYVANDHLTELATRASDHLGALTDGRYALALDDDRGFEIVDHHGGGAVRPVHTLSGGESFLTALSLALALSTQVQARSARPLGFFFLDEGFGTLDPEALERVMTSIENLRDDERVIGLISHVPSIRERVPRYLWVSRPDETAGSTVEMLDN